jgi:hypothetical protein
MKQCNVVLSTWESLADDRSTWRQTVRQGTTSAEAARDEAAINKRARPKQQQLQPQQPSAPNATETATPESVYTAILGGATRLFP